MSKPKARNYQVKDDWFSRVDGQGFIISEWCKKVNQEAVFCQVCTQSISCAAKGFASITQHVEAKKHSDNVKLKLSKSQLHLIATRPMGPIASTTSDPASPSALQPSTVSIYNVKDGAVRAEIIWALKNVVSKMSAASCDDVQEVFEAMFPKSVPQQFSLGRTKLGYLITEALGPHFHRKMLEDARHASWYTLIYDETTNNEGKKELQIAIRYWSELESEIVCRHLTTYFIGYAKAVDLHAEIHKAVADANLVFDNILMLGSDGPNVNKAVWRLINSELIQTRSKGLVDIGTCNLHIVHNAFLKGLKELGDDVSELIINIFYFFDGLPSRWSDYRNIQIKHNVPTKCFLKHVPSRWLTLEAAAARLIEQWPAVNEYFLKFIPQNKSSMMSTSKYKLIMSVLKQKDIKAELHFVVNSARSFISFTRLFQKEEPLIHLLYVALHDLIYTIAARVCKPEVICSMNSKDLFCVENLVELKKVQICDESKVLLQDLTEKERLLFCKKAQQHYIAACKHLLEKTPIGPKCLVKYFQCLQPKERKSSKSLIYIAQIVRELPFYGISSTDVVDEWRLLQLEDINDSTGKIDQYWNEIFKIVNVCKSPKYPLITKVVKACLSLSHGSADVERGFSRSKLILTEDKACMLERTLNAKLNIIDGMKKYSYRAALVPITQELVTAARLAHQKYLVYLEAEKVKLNETAMQKTAEDERLRLEKIASEKLNESNKKLIEMEKDAEIARKKVIASKGSADSLLNEAHRKLKLSLENNDIQGMQVAQGMIEGANSLRTAEREREKVLGVIEEKIRKRKTRMISSMMAKHSKT
jgi:hypothetical protein